jgi:DNA polymerase elongation subunit (family B)
MTDTIRTPAPFSPATRVRARGAGKPPSQHEDLVFQAVAWHADDVDFDDSSDDSNDDEDVEPSQRYVIKAFGVDETGGAVAITITGFTPFLFLKVGRPLRKQDMPAIEDAIKNRLPRKFRDGVESIKAVQRKDFWGFRNGEQEQFLRICFKSMAAFKCTSSMFAKAFTTGANITPRGVAPFPARLAVYGGNLDPLLQFFHVRNIDPCSWVRVPAGAFDTSGGAMPATAKLDCSCSWMKVFREERNAIAPLVIASFDIECSSSHGDFPVARKEYRYVANQVVDLWTRIEGEEKAEARVIQALLNAFDGGSPDLDRVFCKKPVRRKDVESVVKLHRQEILGVLARRLVLSEDRGVLMPSKPADLKRDDVVRSMTAKLNAILPALEGDSVIQIGTTVNVFGEKDASYRHVLTLKGCSPIEGVDVESFESEADLLLRWREILCEIDPDIVTGYNVNGFDFAYMYDRAKELGCASAFMKLGRLSGRTCEFKEQKLASSALGENILRYIAMEGRVIIDLMKVVQRDHKLDSYKLDSVAFHFVGERKDDVSPQDIFRLQKGSDNDRAIVARYCVQDCALVNQLVAKLQVVSQNSAMANVCCVPLSFVFMRGQGIKLFSLVSRQCRADGFVIPMLARASEDAEDDDGYLGATVLDPKTGIHMKPTLVFDYASLYPSSMISENLSHDTLVMDERFDNLPGVEYLDIEYDSLYTADNGKKAVGGKVKCRFVQSTEGVIPRTLKLLLSQRKATRKKMAEPGLDEFTIGVLDGIQLAYKVCANSLYGQCGARTSQIHLKDVAACTTATGRAMIAKAKAFFEQSYGADVIYGDTDSIFVQMKEFAGPDGAPLSGRDEMVAAMDFGHRASAEFRKLLKKPHDLEFEKILNPFILVSKKRYISACFTDFKNPDKFSVKSMGVALKRRDFAPVVKRVFGGLVDIILKQRDIGAGVRFVKMCLEDLVQGRVDMSEFILSKSLRSEYADPSRIAHKVLAERIAERDPGNRPQVGDRLAYVYVLRPSSNGKKLLQGELIETPDYVRQKNLKIDVSHYITNQIMKCVLQVLGLALEQIEGYVPPRVPWDVQLKGLMESKDDAKKALDKYAALREAEVKKLVFDNYINRLAAGKMGNKVMTEFFPWKTKA